MIDPEIGEDKNLCTYSTGRSDDLPNRKQQGIQELKVLVKLNMIGSVDCISEQSTDLHSKEN